MFLSGTLFEVQYVMDHVRSRLRRLDTGVQFLQSMDEYVKP